MFLAQVTRRIAQSGLKILRKEQRQLTSDDVKNFYVEQQDLTKPFRTEGKRERVQGGRPEGSKRGGPVLPLS